MQPFNYKISLLISINSTGKISYCHLGFKPCIHQKLTGVLEIFPNYKCLLENIQYVKNLRERESLKNKFNLKNDPWINLLLV